MTEPEHVGLEVALARKLQDHLTEEELRHRTTDAAFRTNATRMEKIELDLRSISDLVSTAKGFTRAMGIVATILFAIVTAFISIFTWVMLEKNADIKAVQASINDLAIQNSRTLGVMQGLQKDQDRTDSRLQNHIDRDASK
jgi:hypothetical protein